MARGAQRITAAVTGVVGFVAGAEGAGVEVDGVRGVVHVGAVEVEEAAPAGAVVKVHRAAAVEGRGGVSGREKREMVGLRAGGWWVYQSEVRYSLALVRVRGSRAGAALMVDTAAERARASASLVMEKGMLISLMGLGEVDVRV